MKGKRVVLATVAVVVIVTAGFGILYWPEFVERYRFWRTFDSLGLNEQGYPEYIHRPTGIVFVGTSGGTFMMGSPVGEAGRFDYEGPVHEVALSPYLIAKYEVSQKEWAKVMGNNPSKFRGDDLPVETVSWQECQEFCRKTGLGLPTEAQWEYACRTGTTTAFTFGDSVTTEQANFNGNPYAGGPKGKNRERTMPVHSFEPNGFGLHNMHGNVYEWCEDVFDAEFYSKAEAGGPDPVCTSGSGVRVIRGGGWKWFAGNCRSAYRSRGRTSSRSNGIGFRPVWSVTRH